MPSTRPDLKHHLHPKFRRAIKLRLRVISWSQVLLALAGNDRTARGSVRGIPAKKTDFYLDFFVEAYSADFTSLRFTNSSIPYLPNSRPMPERLMPPKGSSAAVPDGSLMLTIPLSRRLAMRVARCKSLVCTEAPRPYAVSLANATAASSLFTLYTTATGPNSSSEYACISGVTPVRIVGSR